MIIFLFFPLKQCWFFSSYSLLGLRKKAKLIRGKETRRRAKEVAPTGQPAVNQGKGKPRQAKTNTQIKIICLQQEAVKTKIRTTASSPGKIWKKTKATKQTLQIKTQASIRIKAIEKVTILTVKRQRLV